MSWSANAAGSALNNTGGISINVFNGGSDKLSIAYWFKSNASMARNSQVSLSNTSGSSAGTLSATGSNVQAASYDGANFRNRGKGSHTFNTSWHHYVFVWPTKTGTFEAWVDGVKCTADLGANATIGTMPTFVNINVNDMDGAIAEIGVWDGIALTATEVGELYTNGYAPDKVAVAYLKHHWSLFDGHTNSGKNDRKGTANLTSTSGSSSADHPAGITYSSGPSVTANDQLGLNESAAHTAALTSKYAKVTGIVDENGSPLTNLTDVRALFFDTPTPWISGNPSVRSSTASIDGTGQLLLDVGASSLTVGQTGFLILTTSDGDPAQSPPGRSFGYPVTVSAS